MFPHQEHVRFIGCVFNTSCPTCAFFMHCTQPPLAQTFATLVMHWSLPYFFILACHAYLMLCNVLLYLRFELHFLIHLAPLMHHQHCSYLHLLPSFILDPLSIPDKKGESILQRMFRSILSFLYDSCAHPQGENFISHAHLQGERYSIGEMHIPRGRKLCVNQRMFRSILSFLYDSCAHPQGEKFYFSCTFVGGRYSIGEMHILKGRRH